MDKNGSVTYSRIITITTAPANMQVLLKAYPNPATDAAYLQVSGFGGSISLTVTDMGGKTVGQQDKLTNGTYTVPLVDLPPGDYFVTAKSITNCKTIKLVKAK